MTSTPAMCRRRRRHAITQSPSGRMAERDGRENKMTASAPRVDRHSFAPKRSTLLERCRRDTGARRDPNRRMTEPGFSLLFAMAAFLMAVTPAAAETVEEFYRSKTITMYVGTGVGAGAVSAYPTALAPLIKKYLPGHPDVIVSYMPGGGGIKAANYIYGIGPQDGTAWGFITRGFLLAPLLKIPQAQFDPNKINWIGSPTRTISMGMVWNASTAVRTIQDAMRSEVVVGATSIAQDTGIFPRALNSIAGTRFKIVPGYAGLGAVDLAIERGEVQGKSARPGSRSTAAQPPIGCATGKSPCWYNSE